MRLTMDILSALKSATKIWLVPGQSVCVGRTRHADYMVPDKYMSSVHFMISCQVPDCRIEDLQSSNGTFLNGQKINDSVLRDGDVIYAGDTIIKIQIDSDPSGRRQTDRRGKSNRTDTQTLDESEVAPPGWVPGYQSEPALSGIHWFRGLEKQPIAWDLIRALAGIRSLHVVVAPGKLTTETEQIPGDKIYLYDWVPGFMQLQLSPRVLGGCDLENLLSLIQQGWGHDALVCVFSKLDTESLTDHLRLAAQGKCDPQGQAVSPHMFHTCQPGVLKQVLRTAAPEFASFVFSQIDALIFESPSAENWEALSAAGLPAAFAELETPEPTEK